MFLAALETPPPCAFEFQSLVKLGIREGKFRWQ